MSPLSITHLLLLTLIVSSTQHVVRASDFPDWDQAIAFKKDLKRSSLVANLPNITGGDHFIGLQSTLSQINSNSGSYQQMPGARLSIYSNPGYNLWAQLVRWPGSGAGFSVGIGVQMEFNGADLRQRKAIGISWSSIFEENYTQRDVSVHGLYGFNSEWFNFGFMAMIDLHHLLVEDGHGIPDYDEKILMAVPYINRLFWNKLRLSLMLPYNSAGPGLCLGSELFIGKRK